MLFITLGLILLVILFGTGLWIAFAMGISSIIMMIPQLGTRVIPLIMTHTWNTVNSYILLAVPLFIFMGELLSTTGISEILFTGLAKVLHRVPGGLVQAVLGACTIFAACSGSSTAGAAIMGRISYHDLTKRGYDVKLTLGAVAAGGTLASLIPPSIIFIVYGDMAGESVGKLFMAGAIPGLMVSGLFMTYVAIRAKVQPHLFPPSASPEENSWSVRLRGLASLWGFSLLVLVVLGSIYGGLATPTEAAALGAVAAMMLAAVYRRLTLRNISEAAVNTVKTTSMVFLIVIAAKFMGSVIAYYRLPVMISEAAVNITSASLVFLGLCVFYLIMGCFFDTLSLMLLSLPFILPIVIAHKMNLILFGVLLTMLLEIGMLTPPVGMNLYVLQGISGRSLKEVSIGSLPFVLLFLIGIAIVYLYPSIALWFPGVMG